MTQKKLWSILRRHWARSSDQVRVSEIEGEKTSVIELSVAKEDLGR